MRQKKWERERGRGSRVEFCVRNEYSAFTLGNSVMYFHFDSLSPPLASPFDHSLRPLSICCVPVFSNVIFNTHKHIIDKWENDSDVLCALSVHCACVWLVFIGRTLHRKVFFFYFAVRISGYLLKPFNQRVYTFFLSSTHFRVFFFSRYLFRIENWE